VPLSATDEKMLTEPTEEEIKEAEHLPYPNLLGVVQYPSAQDKVGKTAFRNSFEKLGVWI
jgi:hypothetical protein